MKHADAIGVGTLNRPREIKAINSLFFQWNRQHVQMSPHRGRPQLQLYTASPGFGRGRKQMQGDDRRRPTGPAASQ